ncbi:MAG: ABC transporter substrate-binding protein [Candidatus Cloacimonetes bacterium]|nr:ABC transporter substrate-binding protein [Candidatus Cloacimonadota bacterium]
MKRIIIIGLIGLLVVSSFVFVSCSKKENIIKIGAVLPLTGDAAQAGVNTRLGIDLKVEEINNSGGIDGKILQIIYEDCQGDPKLAVSSIQKLISIDKVSAVIDNSLSNVTLAMAPIANENEVVLLATGASSPKISDAGDFIFRIWNSDVLEGDVVAEYAYKELSLKKIALMIINNDYGLGLQKVFKNKFEGIGGTIITREMFSPGDKDFKNQITKLLQNNFEAIYLVGYPTECSGVIKQLKNFGYKGIIVGTIVMADPIVQKAVEETGYDCYYPIPKQPDQNDPSVANFMNTFNEKYDQEPPMLADVGYDAIDIITNALIDSKGKEDGILIKEFFYKMPEYNGASGTFKFDKNGDVKKPIIVIK